MNNAIPSFNQLKKELKKATTNFSECNVALLGDTATQLLAKAIKSYGVKKALKLNLYEADYNQIDMQVFDENSELYEHQPQFILLYKESLKLQSIYQKSAITDKEVFAEQQLERLKTYYNAIQNSSNAKVIFFNFIELPDTTFYNYGNKVRHSWAFQIRKLNYMLMDWVADNGNAFVLDLSRLHNQLGRAFCFDPQLYFRADIAVHLDFMPYIAQGVIDIISANIGRFKKCLILDLDNTTWGGIIGDDGIENIQVGKLGIGKAFTKLQRWTKSLKERGVILTICSKNTEHIAKEPFEKHPDMVLRLEDISVFVANWENKADNIRYIQSVLNIGFDSMVFLDDNPFERNLVRQELPEVTVPELPKDPAEYLSYIEQFNLFETTSYSSLDKDRTKQYQTEAKRKTLQKSFSSLADYLENLEMKAIAAPFNNFRVPRVAQLTQRSNQFNLRTIRYSEAEVKDIMASEQHETLFIALKDKYGDYGMISLVIMEHQQGELFIDTWIMSCRVLKRDVEKFVLNEIVILAQKKGIATIVGEWIPTKKSVLVKNHYKQLGFEEKNGKWYLKVANYTPFQHFIQKIEE